MKNSKSSEREAFCIKTSGLSNRERKELATELQKFVKTKKTQFSESRKMEDVQ